MLPKAVLFDLDDTIVSYHSLSGPAWNEVCTGFVAKNKLFEIDTLQELVRRGVKLALLTNGNSRKQRYKISKFDLEKYFHICLVEEEVGFGKPDIRVFQMAINHIFDTGAAGPALTIY